MMPFEDIRFQLVDLPPVTGEFMEPWMIAALQPADAALLVIDLDDPAAIPSSYQVLIPFAFSSARTA